MHQPHQALHSVRSFGLGQIVRLDQSAASRLQISNLRCVQSLSTVPATYTLNYRLVLLRNQFVAGTIPKALARSPSSYSVWDAHSSGERLQILPPMGLTLAEVIRRADAYNHTVANIPSQGAFIGHTNKIYAQVHRRQQSPQSVFTTIARRIQHLTTCYND